MGINTDLVKILYKPINFEILAQELKRVLAIEQCLYRSDVLCYPTISEHRKLSAYRIYAIYQILIGCYFTLAGEMELNSFSAQSILIRLMADKSMNVTEPLVSARRRCALHRFSLWRYPSLVHNCLQVSESGKYGQFGLYYHLFSFVKVMRKLALTLTIAKHIVRLYCSQLFLLKQSIFCASTCNIVHNLHCGQPETPNTVQS